MDDLKSEWQSKRATLSDKTAREEFGLTQDEIVRAIRAGMLHYRAGSMYGNPWLRLLRREVEAPVRKKRGEEVPRGTPSEDGVTRHQPRIEAAEGPDCPLGRAEVKPDRQHREVTGRLRNTRLPQPSLPFKKGRKLSVGCSLSVTAKTRK